MKRSREALVSELVEELVPTRPAPRPFVLALVWLAVSWSFVLAATLAVAPLRPGVLSQLGTPRFLLECLFGLAAGALAIHAVARLGVPQPASTLARALPGLVPLALWVALLCVGLWSPALEPSMLGKRAFCQLQTILFSGPPWLAAILLLRRLAPLDLAASGALAGAAAAALPALVMQWACLYDPAHALTHHLLPILPAVLLGALLGPVVLRRI